MTGSFIKCGITYGKGWLDIQQFFPDYLKDKEIFQVTEVGSGMWNMTGPVMGSDRDLVVIYQDSTKDILKGRRIRDNLPCQHGIFGSDGQEYDLSFMEIGHFCGLLKKGNINAIWALLSPVVVWRQGDIGYLYKLIYNTSATTDIIPSGVGMTLSQLKDAEFRKDMRSPQKSLNTAYRTISFVLNHLLYGKWDFSRYDDLVTDGVNEDLIKFKVNAVMEWGKKMPRVSMPAEEIEHFLFRMRYLNLMEYLNGKSYYF